MMDRLVRDFFLGFIKVHILYHAGQKPVYGLEMIEELRRHGYELSPGTLYPTLHALERAGYLAAERQAVGGRVRRYYRLTERGRDALATARAYIRELTAEVLSGEL
ncbi:MAG: helix-turn-helix transcriptional regulator [Anaerolineae bacterium]|nr:helix-turn-helix transcriptional regulator [Anaerolineae bacterium]